MEFYISYLEKKYHVNTNDKYLEIPMVEKFIKNTGETLFLRFTKYKIEKEELSRFIDEYYDHELDCFITTFKQEGKQWIKNIQ